MIKIAKKDLFDRIAKYYGLFFSYQTNTYGRLFDKVYNELDLVLYREIIDVGCGTGALCKELYKRGFNVTGLDSSKEMLSVAKDKLKGRAINLIHSDILIDNTLAEKTFDVSITSFVAHGLKKEERNILYRQMERITKHMIIIYDYNEKRSMITNILETLEGGDYFNFIHSVKDELHQHFKNLQVIDLGDHASCYVIRVSY